MSDPFSKLASSLSSPASSAAAVTPDNATDLAVVSRALYIGVTGDVTVNMADSGSAITFKAVPVGILPIRVSRVKATGTTATDIVAIW